MANLRNVLRRKSGFAVIPFSAGLIWKGIEIAHNASYVKVLIMEHFDWKTLNATAGKLPPLLLMLCGCAWGLYFELQHRRGVMSSVEALGNGESSSPNQLPVPASDERISSDSQSPLLSPITTVVAEARAGVPDAHEIVVRRTVEVTKEVVEVVVRRESEHSAA
jgi:hypothetical protein